MSQQYIILLRLLWLLCLVSLLGLTQFAAQSLTCWTEVSSLRELHAGAVIVMSASMTIVLVTLLFSYLHASQTTEGWQPQLAP